MAQHDSLIPQKRIEQSILLIRGQKVLLDKDLAEMYGVKTRDLNKAVQRNRDRFPMDFMFQLTQEEFKNLMFHFGTSRWGGTRKLPSAFTELGVAMLSSVLNSKRAVKMSIFIINTFVRLRQMLYTHKELADKLQLVEGKVILHDKAIQEINQVIEELVAPKPEKDKKIGFLK